MAADHLTIDQRFERLPEETRKKISDLLRDDLSLINVCYCCTYGAPFDMLYHDLPRTPNFELYREDPVTAAHIENIDYKTAEFTQLAVCKTVKGYYAFDEYDGKETLFSCGKRVPVQDIIYDTTLDDSQKISKLKHQFEVLKDREERAFKIHELLKDMQEEHTRDIFKRKRKVILENVKK